MSPSLLNSVGTASAAFGGLPSLSCLGVYDPVEDKAMSNTTEIITHRIENMLNHLPCTPSNRILPRVPDHLRRVKNEAYEPVIISMGPYHRGKDYLAAMEEHMFRYRKLFLERRDESSLAKYVEALSHLNERAKNSYEERFSEERWPGEFLETMLVDGCFIVELIRKGVAENVSTEDDDPIFRSRMTLYSLKYDLILLENQIPFFILQELFDMTLLPNEERNLVDMIFRFFEIFPGPVYQRGEHNLPGVPVRHLLGLIHDNYLPSPQGLKTYLNMTDQENERINDAESHIRCSTWLHEAGIKLSIDCGLIRGNEASKEDDAETHIRCATELHEAGIMFKRAEGCSIFDIKFANGVLEIPKLIIEDRTESLLRNPIAYEQFWIDCIYHVIDYARFMDCLINFNKDVELLCRSGIIDNWLGDDEAVASMFNRLPDSVRLYHERSFYSEIYVKVNKYCGRRRILWKAKLRQWKATLRHDYFNGPWALISFLAAGFLLFLTALQTVFSILSYYRS